MSGRDCISWASNGYRCTAGLQQLNSGAPNSIAEGRFCVHLQAWLCRLCWLASSLLSVYLGGFEAIAVMHDSMLLHGGL